MGLRPMIFVVSIMMRAGAGVKPGGAAVAAARE
jgi:hypothetical protein